MRNLLVLKLMLVFLLGDVLADKSQSSQKSGVLESIQTKVLIISSVVLITCIWLGCAYFMANRHQTAVQYLQKQVDELWLLQAKPSVWPHAPFIPSPREPNPQEYIPPKDPQEQEQEAIEAEESAEKAKAIMEARNN